jgi:predicted nucleic acid-binding protein
MTAYVLDTSIISLILREHPTVTARLNTVTTSANHILGCPMVWYEARRGLRYRDAKSQMGLFLKLFSTFEWQEYTREDWTLASDWWAQRRKTGKPIADADLLIAVFARNRNAILISDNEKDFVDLGVTVENWKQA